MTSALLLAGILATTSPKPQQVVFCGTAGGKQHLYVINVDGTGLKQITKSPLRDDGPIWSPDGSLIAFTRVSGYKKGEIRSDGNLFVVRPDGTGLKRLTSGPYYDGVQDWSADGKRIRFGRQGAPRFDYEVDLASGKVTPQGPARPYGDLSPDRKWRVTALSESKQEDDHRSDLWLFNAAGKRVKRLTNFKGGTYLPDWSPDSRHIAVVIERGPGCRLYIVSIPDGKMKLIAGGDHYYFESPRWSPDGERITYLQSIQRSDMKNDSFRQLYVSAPDGTGKKRLTNHWCNDYNPQWTRDGKSIVIQGERGMQWEDSGGVSGESTSHLIVVDASGKGERILSTGVPVYGPVLRR